MGLPPLLAALFGTFGAFWVSYAALLWMLNAEFLALGADLSNLTGLFFIGWAVPAVFLVVATLRQNGAVALMLALLAAAFIVVSLGYFTDTGGWMTVAGWLAIVTAVVAWYGSAADAINSAFGRVMLPTRTLKVGVPLEPEHRRPELA